MPNVSDPDPASPPLASVQGPDFLCIGMQKAGTGWLYDQLSHHPQFWMPPLKEIHFLDREMPKFGTARKFRNGMQRRQKQGLGQPARRRPIEQRDMDFLDALEALRGKPRDVASYGRIFRFKNGQLSGDVTPGYSVLREDVIAEIARILPHLRIVQLVRDPVQRLWSQLSMAARRGRFDARLTGDPSAFHSYLDKAGGDDDRDETLVDIAKVAFPARVAARWDRAAPKLRFRHFFFDDIIERPDGLRADILTFLGADPDVVGGPPPEENRKSSFEKLPLTPEIEAVMVDFFRDEIEACATRFGGHAENWAARYRV